MTDTKPDNDKNKPENDKNAGAELYPVLPLRDIVVFPYMIVPLFVGLSLIHI